MARLLGIDIGTSACKVALFDESGRVVAQASRPYPVKHPQPGWAQQNPEAWWHAVCAAVCDTIEASGNEPIDCIGLDGQSWSAILIDDRGSVLCDTPIWMDTRAQAHCQRMDQVLGVGTLFASCGNPTKPSYTLPKVLWYKDNMPEAYANAAYVLQSNSFIGYRLTGEITQDASQGYGLQCFDMRSDSWNMEVLRALGIRESLLPPIVASERIIGRVTAEAARASGLTEGTPVVAGGLDAACGCLGAGVYRPGQTQEQGGQAGGMSICLDIYTADPRLILSRHVVPGRWLLQGGTVGGGGALRWLREQVCPELTFEEMSVLAGTIPAGSEGLIFLPYMAGERSPIWDPDAKGVFFGLDYTKTRAHMIRACMEGVAYALRHNLETAYEAGAEVSALHAMGGSANSHVWTQLKADVTDRVIGVPASDTATTLGAAMLAGVGAGVYKDFDEAVTQTVSISRWHTPQPEHAKVYAQGYQAYRTLYERLQGLT